MLFVLIMKIILIKKWRKKLIDYPIIINFPKRNLKIFRIFTPRNSTIIVNERNKICSWGEINKKYFSSIIPNHNKNDTIVELSTNQDTIHLINYSFNGGEGDDIKLRKSALNAKIK